MSSKQKRKQARLNGAKAAGAKSPAGLAASSKNATTHGLFSKMIVLSNESQARFDELHHNYILQFQPTTGVEMDLIDQMVSAQWRLRRIWTLETAAFDFKMDEQHEEVERKFRRIDQATR